MRFGHYRVPFGLKPVFGRHDTSAGIPVYYVAWAGHQVVMVL
jgi:hypothetical protein